jgi:hypothetical protein
MVENDSIATEGDGEEHQPVPADLLELHEVIEWNAAVEKAWKEATNDQNQ